VSVSKSGKTSDDGPSPFRPPQLPQWNWFDSAECGLDLETVSNSFQYLLQASAASVQSAAQGISEAASSIATEGVEAKVDLSAVEALAESVIGDGSVTFDLSELSTCSTSYINQILQAFDKNLNVGGMMSDLVESKILPNGLSELSTALGGAFMAGAYYANSMAIESVTISGLNTMSTLEANADVTDSILTTSIGFEEVTIDVKASTGPRGQTEAVPETIWSETFKDIKVSVSSLLPEVSPESVAQAVGRAENDDTLSCLASLFASPTIVGVAIDVSETTSLKEDDIFAEIFMIIDAMIQSAIAFIVSGLDEAVFNFLIGVNNAALAAFGPLVACFDAPAAQGDLDIEDVQYTVDMPMAAIKEDSSMSINNFDFGRNRY